MPSKTNGLDKTMDEQIKNVIQDLRKLVAKRRTKKVYAENIENISSAIVLLVWMKWKHWMATRHDF